MPPTFHIPPTTFPLFHLTLLHPEIPNNTGNIGRTCVATGCALHLIHPIGFDTSVKACRRAGLDYWPRLAPTEHASWDAYLAHTQPSRERLWLFTTKSARPIWDATLSRGDHLVFGRETAGLPDELLHAYEDRLLTLPMIEGERSLNLATAACAVIYEGLRQLASRGELRLTPEGRLPHPAPPKT